mgnify:FL=1
MESYNKLVRDKIPKILDEKGVTYEKRVASPEEYKIELIKKLKEEALEFFDDPSTEELADVIEVIDALKNLTDYADVEVVRKMKSYDRGAFDKRIILKGQK